MNDMHNADQSILSLFDPLRNPSIPERDLPELIAFLNLHPHIQSYVSTLTISPPSSQKPSFEGRNLPRREVRHVVQVKDIRDVATRLPRLQTLKLDTYRGGSFQVAIEDQDLRDAAIAWPDLRVISLAKSSTILPRISLVGVQTLYNICSNLREVSMSVNCDLQVERTTRGWHIDTPTPKSRQRALERLYLTFVLRPEEEDWLMGQLVVAAICSMFPQLDSFSPSLQDDPSAGTWGIDVGEQWRQRR